MFTPKHVMKTATFSDNNMYMMHWYITRFRDYFSDSFSERALLLIRPTFPDVTLYDWHSEPPLVDVGTPENAVIPRRLVPTLIYLGSNCILYLVPK
tara:strand:- start:134 stop:421 length:288 start_codon:yes stop_codon:yes gene_type:complete